MEKQVNKHDTIVVVLSIVALLISSVSTYINFFYHKNELAIAVTWFHVKDSTLTIDMSWINSGNKSIALSDVTLNISNETFNSTSSNDDFTEISSMFLEPGDIMKKTLSVKNLGKNFNNNSYPFLIAKFSIISSGGTYNQKHISFGKVSYENGIFNLNGSFVDLMADLNTGTTTSNSKNKVIVNFTL